MDLKTPKGTENSALKEKDGMNYEEQETIQINEKGIPTKRVNPEIFENDVPAFWRLHEPKLWATIIILALYFVLRLMT